MNYTEFQALTVIGNVDPNTQIEALSGGTPFIFKSQKNQLGDYGGLGAAGQARKVQEKGTELRHKVHFQRRITIVTDFGPPVVEHNMEYPQGVIKLYVAEYDLLTSDPRTDERLEFPVRVGKDKLKNSKQNADGAVQSFDADGNVISTLPVGDNYQPGPNASRDDDAAHDIINHGGKWEI